MRAPSSFHSTDARPDLGQRRGDVGRARGEHRQHAASHLEPDRRRARRHPAVSAITAVRPRSPDSIAARRTSAAGTDAGPRDGVSHEAAERALAQLTDEQAAEEVGFGRRWPARRVRAGSADGRRPNRFPSSPGAGRARDRRRAIVSVGATAGVTSSRDTVGPPDTDASLARLADQEPDGGLDLVGGGPAQQLGQGCDLRRSRPRRRDRLRRRDEVREQHGGQCARGPSEPGRRQGVSTTLPGMCSVDLAMKASPASESGYTAPTCGRSTRSSTRRAISRSWAPLGSRTK